MGLCVDEISMVFHLMAASERSAGRHVIDAKWNPRVCKKNLKILFFWGGVRSSFNCAHVWHGSHSSKDDTHKTRRSVSEIILSCGHENHVQTLHSQAFLAQNSMNDSCLFTETHPEKTTKGTVCNLLPQQPASQPAKIFNVNSLIRL